MSNTPEIAPEIRGLLEEIVADPRSSIRLVPQRALRSWFERGEPVRAREVAETRAERHLIEVHREALAEILWSASRIAFWKAPLLTHSPIGPDGRPYNPAHGEAHWIERARRVSARMPRQQDGVDLLWACLGGIEPHMAFSLSLAALGLVPSDRRRLQTAFAVPQNQPRTAAALLHGLTVPTQAPRIRSKAHLSLGARLCAIGSLEKARDHYVKATVLEGGGHGRFYVFNLSCCLGHMEAARTDGRELKDLAREDNEVVEAGKILRDWFKTRSMTEKEERVRFMNRISDQLPVAALALLEGDA